MSYKFECSTASKRKALVRRTCDLAVKHGADYTIDNSEPLETSVLITLDGFAVRMYFRGRARIDTFFGHWFTGVSKPGQRYPENFDITIGGTMNQHHFAKATSYAETYADFYRSLDDGLGRLVSLRSPA
jgi:hypothetical protein